MIGKYFSTKFLVKKRRAPGANWRQRGDTFRNVRRWSDAAEAYARYLDRNPKDSAIWIQYGHMLKEAGELEKAIAAYNRSEELDPGDAERDIHLFHLRERLAGVVAAETLSSISSDELNESPRKKRPAFGPTSHVQPGTAASDIVLIADRLRRSH